MQDFRLWCMLCLSKYRVIHNTVQETYQEMR